MNSGVYRFMLKERALTGIDIVTPNNMRLFAQRAWEAGRPCPISISIGTHPMEIMGAGYRAPIGMDEMAITGGIRGAAVELAPCETIDLPYVADAEIVLEAEILPTGWTQPEGRFGEFTGLMGGLHWNPNVRVKAVLMRHVRSARSAHALGEHGAAPRYQAIRRCARGHSSEGHQRDARGAARSGIRSSRSQTGGRRKECTARCALRDGPQARGRRR
jgi:2,5-furandicarboxylate decarboxylase 1